MTRIFDGQVPSKEQPNEVRSAIRSDQNYHQPCIRHSNMPQPSVTRGKGMNKVIKLRGGFSATQFFLRSHATLRKPARMASLFSIVFIRICPFQK